MNFALVMGDVFPLLMRGMVITVQTTVFALIIALFLGLLSCLMGMSQNPAFRLIAKAYIWAIRGTPLLVQTFFIYFGVPQLIQSIGLDFRLSPLAAGIITLSINAGAYIAEHIGIRWL